MKNHKPLSVQEIKPLEPLQIKKPGIDWALVLEVIAWFVAITLISGLAAWLA